MVHVLLLCWIQSSGVCLSVGKILSVAKPGFFLLGKWGALPNHYGPTADHKELKGQLIGSTSK